MNITIDVTNTILSTERLILRVWKETDLDEFYEYASEEGVGEMAGWKHHDSIDITWNILQNFINKKNVFAIVNRESNKVIGSLGLHYSWVNKNDAYAHLNMKEIGYVLSKAHWGKGIMAEAVLTVIGHCFHQYEFDALTISHFTTNTQSKRVIEKCGFKYLNQSQYYAKKIDKTFENWNYILFRNEFLSK